MYSVTNVSGSQVLGMYNDVSISQVLARNVLAVYSVTNVSSSHNVLAVSTIVSSSQCVGCVQYCEQLTMCWLCTLLGAARNVLAVYTIVSSSQYLGCVHYCEQLAMSWLCTLL
ncbi:hypothetical protein RRG08_058666 [Elysia crispata]|uniref:Uncharacterized protein n=1 Tax=Elysia crispata TaxID=231223 RepID=A0AAE0YXL5_9GAST|nr:hypothetical protein RRG08_058666 [Elysia crispata]